MASLKARATVRLERTADGVVTFWEITRVRAALSTRFGRKLSTGRSSAEKTFPSARSADAAMQKAIAEKRLEGYDEPVTRGQAGAQSKKGVAARNPELEALIMESPSDDAHYLVYADWLQQECDARGELIIAQHGITASEDPRAVDLHERDQALLFRTFEEELLGPLARYVMVADSFRSYRSFSWRYGFIRKARLDRTHHLSAEVDDVLEKLLTHPSGRFLEQLMIDNWTRDVGASVARVLTKHAPPTLVSMIVLAQNHRVDWLWSTLPRLRRLRIDTLNGAAIHADALETLWITFAKEPDLESLRNAHAPRLRRLHLTLSHEQARQVDAVPIAPATLPSLEHLSVRRWLMRVSPTGAPSTGELVPQDLLAIGVASAAAARGLTRLDLQLVVSRAGVDALVARADRISAIAAIHVPRNGVLAEDRPRLERALPNLRWAEDPDEEDVSLEAVDPFPRSDIADR